MNAPSKFAPVPTGRTPQDWVRELAAYRDPSTSRSFLELGITAGAFMVLGIAAWWAMTISLWLTLALSVLNGIFLVRLFIIQHDCGHRAFFKSRTMGDWVGRVIGTLTLTPYDVWRQTHALHHAHSGNLDRRGIGDIHTLTVAEYGASSGWDRLVYRLYRNPLVLFGLGPIYLFYFQNRVPLGLMNIGKYWISAMATNVATAVGIGAIVWFGGLAPLVLIFVPTTYVGAAIGLWLFYVQHQFEPAHWDREQDWKLHDAAYNGSSHYALPKPVQWLTANIGIHHVHHLYSRIPFYRLTEVLRDHPVLEQSQRLTFLESLACIKLQLWDERSRQLLSRAQARKIYGAI